MNINKLFELNELAKKEAQKYPKKRELYTKIFSSTGKHFNGIVGARGVEKSVILKQIMTIL
ncbi:MAG: hypothetical protein KAT05_16760 [Spirochaetes bacterium]|nr:hypothetical protein [Spirochaetota bacterium]